MRALLVAIIMLGASTAHASKPVGWTMKGCVVDGIFFSVDNDRAAVVRKMTDKPLDLSKAEGKWIEVDGLLYPGDFFAPSSATPKIKGDCTADHRTSIQYAKAHGLRMDGARLAHEGKLDDAMKLVEASIKLVQPADCDTYIDRAHLHARKASFKSAAADIAILHARTCRFRGALNWLLLQELGNELRTRKQPRLAVDALTLARAHCDSDLCRPGIEKDLAAAQRAVKK